MKKSILYPIYIAVLLALLYISKVGPIVMSTLNHIISPIHCPGILLCAIAAMLIITVEILRHHYPIKTTKSNNDDQSPAPLYSDQPTTIDKYDRTTSATLLAQKIFTTFNSRQAEKGSFVININEAYGFGKTSFLRIFEQQLKSINRPYIFIDYRPWLCDNEESIIHEFFTQLCSTKELDDTDLKNDLSNYLALLLQHSEDFAPSWTKPFARIATHFITPKSLQQTHDNIQKALVQINQPIIVTIDDVDRLQEKELTAVLKLIRDTADFPNVFYILAADNSHIEAMLDRMGIKQPNIFLKKFFNLNFLLPAHESVELDFLLSEVKSILIKYGYNPQGVEQIMPRFKNTPKLSKAFDNMRDVNRFLNTFTVHLDMFKHYNTLGSIDAIELFYLTIIKHLRIDVYKKLRDRNDEYLQVIERNNDRYFMLKDHIDINQIRMSAEASHFAKFYAGIDNTKDKKEKEDKEPKEPTISETLSMTEITHDDVVIILLGRLFGNDPENRINNRSICRCNCYHIYFSGKPMSDKLSYAESINILRNDLPKYKTTLKSIFESNKENSLKNEFSYAFRQSGIPRTDGVKKFNIFLRFRYQYKRFDSAKNFRNVTDYLNWVEASESFSDFLYNIYGKQRNAGDDNIKKAETEMRQFCNDEEDLNMLLLSFTLFSRQLGIFCFSRNFVNEMLRFLADRFFNENLKNKDYPAQDDIFNTIMLIKEEIYLKDYWNGLFIDYLAESKDRAVKWISSVIERFPNGNIDWHYDHRTAVLGEYQSDWESFINQMTQKIPECAETLEDLNNLLIWRSLTDRGSGKSKFISLALKTQGYATGID